MTVASGRGLEVADWGRKMPDAVFYKSAGEAERRSTRTQGEKDVSESNAGLRRYPEASPTGP